MTNEKSGIEKNDSQLNRMKQNSGKVLLVEDNVDLNNTNRRALELYGYSVDTAFSLAQAWDYLEKTEPDIILLDVMLGDGDGFDFCREIREKTQAHILFLTAKTEHEDIVSGLSCGGDDYITKPFRVDELLARVDSVTRRRGMPAPLKTINKGELVINMVSDQAFLGGKDLLLSQKEFSVLRLMARNEGKHLDAEYIYKTVWGRQVGNDTNAVRITVCRLRSKLANSGYNIFAKRAQGYVFDKITAAKPNMTPNAHGTIYSVPREELRHIFGGVNPFDASSQHDANDSDNIEKLTEQERKVAEMVLQGLSYTKTAECLGIKPNTVKSHIKNIYAKLRINSKHELFSAMKM